MKRPLAVAASLALVFMQVGSPQVSANDGLISRTDGPWTYKYGIANTDGLFLQEVKYNGKFVFGKLSLVQVEIEYRRVGVLTDVLYDEMGHGPATGPVLYPPFGSTTRTIGGDGTVSLTQEFRLSTWAATNPCDYRYRMEYDLHPNGDIHPWVWAYGPGCLQATHTALYHFFSRADFDIRGGTNDKFNHWHTTSWENPATEAANPHHDDGDNLNGQNSGAEWQTWEPTAPSSTYNFDPGTADQTELWLVQFDANTGGINSDLIGQTQLGVAWHFPSQWAGGESVQNQDITHWYVVHATRAAGYGNGPCWPNTPCLRGPDKLFKSGTW